MPSIYGSGPVTAIGTAPTKDAIVDPLISGTKWGTLGLGWGATVTYSFPTSFDSGALLGVGTSAFTYIAEPNTGGEALSSVSARPNDPRVLSQTGAVRDALQKWANVANLTFVEVPDTPDTDAWLANDNSSVGDLRFAMSDAVRTAAAYGPGVEGASGGDVWFNKRDFNEPAAGDYAYATFMHEIGHALGLEHPHQERDGDTMAGATDALKYTLMSYRDFVGDNTEEYNSVFGPTTPMLYDVLAIQKLYGANWSHRSGNDTYRWELQTDPTTGAVLEPTVFECIWDGGGIDTLDASNQLRNVELHLTSGIYSTIGASIDPDGNDPSNPLVRDNLVIAFNCTIENAVGSNFDDTIYGNTVGNRLFGGAGNDTMYGSESGEDTPWDADHMSGNDGNDWIVGYAGDDFIYGDEGVDTLWGGSGQDWIFGGNGDDQIFGEWDRDVIQGGLGNDYILGGSGWDVMRGEQGNDELYGEDGNDEIYGGEGDDHLGGGAGVDVLYGGWGDDTYRADDWEDTLNETWGEGIDTVWTALNFYVLPANLEQLSLVGDYRDQTGFGNELDNMLFGNGQDNGLVGGDGNDLLAGNGGADVLLGGPGNDRLNGGWDSAVDSLNGGSGDDTYFVADVNDRIGEYAFEGVDTVESHVTFTLGGNVENLTLLGSAPLNGYGSELDNVITGNGAHNVLAGGDGFDVIHGGDGGDEIYGDNGSGFLYGEAGDDIVYGGSGIDEMHGGDGADWLVGYAGADFLAGDTGNDTLWGNAGADVLQGGDGNDVLHGEWGDDNLQGGNGNDALWGEDGTDILMSGAGEDTLDGGAGADALYGGAGHDIYYQNSRSEVDTVVELEGEGYDTVYSMLWAYALPDNIENLYLNWVGDIAGTGNALSNVISGNSDSNRIDGGAGADWLQGRAGNDTLTGGSGLDRFVFDTPLDGSANVDVITDFSATRDTIVLGKAVFTTLAGSNAPLAPAEFLAGAGATAAADATDRILYNTTTGDLYFDVDGLGGSAAALFAKLAGAPAITASDLVVGG